jgi:hypothetical protein
MPRFRQLARTLRIVENEPLHIIIPKWVRYMAKKSHAHKKCGIMRKSSFCIKGYAKFHIQRPFFDYNKGHMKNSSLQIQRMATYFGASSILNFCFLKNTKISSFGGFLEFFNLIVFKWILENFSNFGEILLHW